MIEIHPLGMIGEVEPGTDLATILSEALLAAGQSVNGTNVLVVTQKIVSKAEDRYVDLDSVNPSEEALRLARVTGKDPRLVELVLTESTAVIRAAPNVLITRHRCGQVMANAGIDRSNTGGGGRVLLLPQNADLSAERLRQDLGLRFRNPPAVVISDSFGRPWRYGVVNVALGACGLPALIDKRGEPDRDGRPLEVTQIAFADIIASAAGLVMGEGAEGVPAALIRGAIWPAGSRSASALLRPLSEDLFQ
ncbi:MAG TPA: coenzyme F420-0:L-glutamate ligase [Steroidobacteraceae bacterium]|nr:coenzyme F420-0:L-glutamate ligase [Steroidobacteraceae bacterium]